MPLAAVIDPRGGHLDRAGARDDLALAGVAVADHQPPPGGVHLLGVGLQVGTPLCLQRDRNHLACSHPAQLVQIHQPVVPERSGLVRWRVSVMY